VDLSADDLALISLLVRGDPAFEQIPVDFRRSGAWLHLAAAHAGLGVVAVVQDLEPDQFVDVAGGQRGLVKLHPELLHSDSGNVDHRQSPARLVGRALPAGPKGGILSKRRWSFRHAWTAAGAGDADFGVRRHHVST